VQPLSLDAFGEPLHTVPAFTASVCNLNPTSRGTVTLRSAKFEDAPAIAPNYLSTDADRKVAADSLRVTPRIVAQPALAKYKPQEWKPGTQFQSDEDLARLAGDIATTIFHPVGTTKMGRDDDPMAVLDSQMRVRDGQGGLIGGLRVVDAGAMPTITSGNTNSPTLMMAEKAAGWIPMPQAVGANRRVIDPSAQPADVASTVCVVRITGSRRPGVRKQGLGPAGFSGLALARDGRACGRSGRSRWRDGS
jgi:choline dehydrogenase